MRSKKLKNQSPGMIKSLILQTLLSMVMVLGIQGAVFAADPPPSPATPPPAATESFKVTDYLSATNQGKAYFNSKNPLASFIIQVVNFLVLTIGSVCFVALVIGGFVLLTSHGNENSVSKGKEILQYAIIGLVIVLTSYFITAFVQSLFYELPTK